jgi:hypothetical protein
MEGEVTGRPLQYPLELRQRMVVKALEFECLELNGLSAE